MSLYIESLNTCAKRKKYNDVLWLLLASLDNVTKEKDGLRDKMSWVQMYINKPRFLIVLRKRTIAFFFFFFLYSLGVIPARS